MSNDLITVSGDDLITVSGNNYQLVDNECVLSTDKLPGWLIGYINDLVNLKIKELSLSISNTVNNTVNNYTEGFDTYVAEYVNKLSTINYGDTYDFLSGYNARVLAALDALEVVKNDYREYIIRNITENSALVAYIQTLNSNIAGNDATIKTLLQTYATRDFVAASTGLILTAELNGGTIGARISEAQTAMATQYGAMAHYVRGLEARYTDDISELQGKAGVYEAAIAYSGKSTDGPGVDSIAGRASRIEAYLTNPNGSGFYSTGVTQDIGGYVKATVDDGGKAAVVDAYSKFSTITINGKSYVNGFGLFSKYNSDTNKPGTSGDSTFWVAADKFKIYNPEVFKDTAKFDYATIEGPDGKKINVVTGIKESYPGVVPFKIEGGVTYMQNVVIGQSVGGLPGYTSGAGDPPADTPGTSVIDGSVYRDTRNQITYTRINGTWVATVPQTQITGIAFKRASNASAAGIPSGGSYASPTPTSGGWQDGIPPTNTAGDPCYFTTHIFTSDGKHPQKSNGNSWSTPQLLSNTADFKIIYSSNALTDTPRVESTAPDVPVTGWDSTPNTTHNWAATSSMKNDKWTPWAVYKIRGETGYAAVNFYITNSNAVFNLTSDGAIAPASGITLNTAFTAVTGTISYTWYKNGSIISGATASSYLVQSADYSGDITSNTYKCTISGTMSGVAGTLSDSITIPKLVDGSSASTVVLSNENITFSAPTTGYTGMVFTSGDCDVTAYIGSTKLTYMTTASPTAANNVNKYTVDKVTTSGATVNRSNYTLSVAGLSSDTAYCDVTTTLYGPVGTVHSTITSRVTYSVSRAGSNGASAFSVHLTNDSAVVPMDSLGNNGNYAATPTDIYVYLGSTQLSYEISGSSPNTFTIGTPTVSNIFAGGISRISTSSIPTGPYHASVAAASGMGPLNTASITFPITAYSATGAGTSLTVTQAFSSTKSGVAGVSPTAYAVTADTATIKKSATGTLSPATVTFTAYKYFQSTVSTVTAWFKVYENDSTTAVYTSSRDGQFSGVAYTPTASATSVKCYMYTDNTFTNLVDIEGVTIVKDGGKGDRGAFSVNLDVATTSTSYSSSTSITASRLQGDTTWVGTGGDILDTFQEAAGYWTSEVTGSTTPVNGDSFTVNVYNSYLDTKPRATIQWVYKGSWVWNVAHYVHGDAIVDGSLTVNKIKSGEVATGLSFYLDSTASAGYGAAVVGKSTKNSLSVGTGGVGYYGVAGVGTHADGAGVIAGYRSLSDGESTRAAFLSTKTHAASFRHDIQVTGTTTSFTGAHEVLMEKDDITPEIGDVMVDCDVFVKMDINNTVSVVTLSTSINDKAVVGVYNMPMQAPPVILTKNGNTIDPYFKEAYAEYTPVVINSLGEGLVNVCGLGGNLEPGDLITSSSIPGKGMKQSDDLVRNYTVGKCREHVTFDYPEQVKQIACIYMCG